MWKLLSIAVLLMGVSAAATVPLEEAAPAAAMAVSAPTISDACDREPRFRDAGHS